MSELIQKILAITKITTVSIMEPEDLKLNKLRNEIVRMEATLSEIESNRQSNKKRKELPRLKLVLQRLQSKYENQCQLLENLEEMSEMIIEMHRAAVEGDVTIVRRLLSRGVDPNKRDESGSTAFMYACDQGHVDIAKMMIEYGARVNDDSITSPLILATAKCHVDIVKLLLEHGATVDQRDSTTPLLIACEKDSDTCVNALLHAGANPNRIDELGNTGLHYAAINGNHTIARLLMEYGANNVIHNKSNMNALSIARSHSHFQVVDELAKK